ncbi:MAG: ferritin-like domain-containing protein [Clostridia bacterium]|nr:ferritin-like domain-containing protein [Clostridia bacterium]
MVVRSEQEALFIACEMESTAVQLYSRALALMEQQDRQGDPLYAGIQEMLEDEKGHLRRFRSLYQGLDAADEQQLTLSAVGEGVLFEGGLMGAARRGLLKDVPSMLKLAINAEKTSIRKYREFAEAAQTEEARSALLRIAEEESGHLMELEATAETNR